MRAGERKGQQGRAGPREPRQARSVAVTHLPLQAVQAAHVQRQVEGAVDVLEGRHAPNSEVHIDSRIAGALARPADGQRHEVDARDTPPGLGEID
jgi:hypothetical protein